MARVTLEGIRKIYEEKGREHVVVHGIDLVIPDGEFLVLVGPSGCGKSTTLRMIAGLETITAGTLRIGDRVVNEIAARDRDIAMVFQNYALYPHMSVRENLAFALKLRKLSGDEIARRVTETAELLGLTPLLDRRPRQLSGGQRQRVALGRAIVRQPQVFLFDEPLSNLDAKLRVQMRREIAALRRRLGTTTIYVTHDQVEAMTLGDRIVVMQEGRVQQVDTPLDLYRRPANTFVATFVGSPPMNLVAGAISSDGSTFRSKDGSFTLPLPGLRPDGLTPGRPVILGIRPEGLAMETGGSETAGAMIEEIEPLGNETLVSLSSGGVPFTARVEGSATPRRGDAVTLTFPAAALHWFDAAGETRLG
ncbi:MAG TPA: sn-glycerol-3-phosphate ABC transporter ATP-binding protein UgpC [Gemmatimonadales bacterium]|nr:sn-glycerol-3-phosphate ABC transporter ATP-binding protein UgpC [Gemmatimonadales bacterium]